MAIGTPLNLGNHDQAASTTNILTTSVNDAPVGSLIVLLVAFTTVADTLSSVADSAGNTYVVIGNKTGTGIGVGIAHCSNSAFDLPVGGTITATFAGSVTTKISAIVVSGCNGGVDKSGIVDSGLAAVTTAAMVTGVLAVADELIVNLVGTAGTAATFTQSSGFTKIGQNITTAPGILSSYKIVAVTTSVSCTSTWTTANNYAALMVTFQITAAAATFVPFVSVYPPLIAQ